MKNKCYICLLLVMVLLVGCNSKESVGEDIIYYVNASEDGITEREVSLNQNSIEERIRQAISFLSGEDAQGDYQIYFTDDLRLDRFSYHENKLILYLEGNYEQLSKSQKLLLRLSLVKTFTEFSEIESVAICINGNPLLKSDGTSYGYMTGEEFLEIDSKSAGTENFVINLYFPDKDGDSVVSESRCILLHSYETLEKQVIDELMKGPEGEGMISVIPDGTNLFNVITVDKICYVNFDSHFLESTYSVEPILVINSISKSLKEIEGVEGVKIQVNGSSEWMFLDTVDLRDIF